MKKLEKLTFAVVILAAAFLFAGVKDVHAQSGQMDWYGTIDDVVQIRIRNRNAKQTILGGRGYNDDRFSFSGRLPRQNVSVRVDKKDGRGKVFIIQQPNRRNNFTTIVRIEDSKGGPDRYHFVLRWD